LLVDGVHQCEDLVKIPFSINPLLPVNKSVHSTRDVQERMGNC
jgi:hypothetical protein